MEQVAFWYKHGMLLFISKCTQLTLVKIQPLVIFIICDTFERRNKNQKWVIGVLLGKIKYDVVNVNNCFSVIHEEKTNKVIVDIQQQDALVSLYQHIASRKFIVGWFIVGKDIFHTDLILHTSTIKNA